MFSVCMAVGNWSTITSKLEAAQVQHGHVFLGTTPPLPPAKSEHQDREMQLRDTNPQRLDELMEQVQQEWVNTTQEERVQKTWDAFVGVYAALSRIAWDIEASQYRPVSSERTPPAIDDIGVAQIRDQIAGQALRGSGSIEELIDKLEARQQIIATENFGDQTTSTGRSSDTVLVLINCLRPIAEVIFDAAATAKSGTMTTLQTAQRPNPSPQVSAP